MNHESLHEYHSIYRTHESWYEYEMNHDSLTLSSSNPYLKFAPSPLLTQPRRTQNIPLNLQLRCHPRSSTRRPALIIALFALWTHCIFWCNLNTTVCGPQKPDQRLNHSFEPQNLNVPPCGAQNVLMINAQQVTHSWFLPAAKPTGLVEASCHLLLLLLWFVQKRPKQPKQTWLHMQFGPQIPNLR